MRESSAGTSPVRELRVALTVADYQEALRFYRDARGLPVVEEWDGAEGAGAALDAGRATSRFSHRNVRLRAPDGMQLTLFTVVGDE